MHPRKRLSQSFRALTTTLAATVALVVGAPNAAAQGLRDFPYTDSLTAAQHKQARWRALDSTGRLALGFGTDYPALRRRLGAAALHLNRPANAMQHYRRALRADPLDTTARVGLVVACLTMNQPEAAAFYARHLADSVRAGLHLRARYAVRQIELEVSGQSTTSDFRGNATFTRLSIGSQISPRFFLTQAVSYYGQSVQLPELSFTDVTYAIRQPEYYALLTGQISGRWQARAGYHYIGCQFGDRDYPGHIGYAGLAYAHPYLVVQGGYSQGTLTDTVRRQADLRLTAYPLGNMRLYGFGRTSVVRSGGRNAPNTLLGLGVQVRPWGWLEVFGSSGEVPILLEANAAYVYNLLDPQRRRAGASAYIRLPHHLLWRVHYTAEQRHRALTGATNYTLYALTTALAWTW